MSLGETSNHLAKAQRQPRGVDMLSILSLIMRERRNTFSQGYRTQCLVVCQIQFVTNQSLPWHGGQSNFRNKSILYNRPETFHFVLKPPFIVHYDHNSFVILVWLWLSSSLSSVRLVIYNTHTCPPISSARNAH